MEIYYSLGRHHHYHHCTILLLTIDLTRQFPQFHLGMSIFCLSSLFPLNYYQTEKLAQNKRKMINCLRADCKVKVSCYLVKSVKFPALALIIQAFLMNHRSKVKVSSPPLTLSVVTIMENNNLTLMKTIYLGFGN